MQQLSITSIYVGMIKCKKKQLCTAKKINLACQEYDYSVDRVLAYSLYTSKYLSGPDRTDCGPSLFTLVGFR